MPKGIGNYCILSNANVGRVIDFKQVKKSDGISEPEQNMQQALFSSEWFLILLFADAPLGSSSRLSY